ncbi:hypothetical protein Bca52824_037518 [Brassica carinata]|uniref:Uncharacterized protein n=1 Tax=Brassica carinata TaxID=52824 RepID=A0A8X7UU31_BRACI|nr:hypothetical protein Bca52824_037518 [Brassica carinata]
MRQSDGDRRAKRIGFCGPIHVLAHQSFPTLAINYFTVSGNVRNEKAGRYLRSMRLKKSIRFSHRLPHDDPLDLRILQKLLSFELNERPTVEEGLVLTLVEYFKGVAKKETIFEF